MAAPVSGDVHISMSVEKKEDKGKYTQRAQWLRAAVLGANDGLVSVASLMMGVGSVKQDVKAMLLAGFAGLVAGACSMAIGEYVSVCTQRDIETAHMKRDDASNTQVEAKEDELPNPGQAAVASALAFSVGATTPLLAAVFIDNHKVRLTVVAVVATLALVVFGGVSAVLGKTPLLKSTFRVVFGGLLAMSFTFGLTKLIGSNAMQI